jgi:threonine dehydrogenase-like Zn-dependent dehydrogenase
VHPQRGPDALLLAGCDPAERYPALQALLPGAAAHVREDGTVVVAGVCSADEHERLLPYFVGASVLVVGSRQVPGRAWVHLAVDAEAAGGTDPVCTVVTAELAQRLGWCWPLVDGSGSGSVADTGRDAAAG